MHNVWLTDSIYLAAKQREIELVLKSWEDQLKNYEYKPTVSECEEYAQNIENEIVHPRGPIGFLPAGPIQKGIRKKKYGF